MYYATDIGPEWRDDGKAIIGAFSKFSNKFSNEAVKTIVCDKSNEFAC